MGADPGRKVLSYRWLIFVIMASAYFAAFFHRVCPAVIALDSQETVVGSTLDAYPKAAAETYPLEA